MTEDNTTGNPYAAPVAGSAERDYVTLNASQPKNVHGWWLLMVAVNIPLPLYLGAPRGMVAQVWGSESSCLQPSVSLRVVRYPML